MIEQRGARTRISGTAVDRAPAIGAVQRVLRDGLSSGASAFVPGLKIWTYDTAVDLRRRFVDQPDQSADTFLVKLERQLAGAPHATIVLAAELLYVNLVPLKPEQIGLPRKREILNEVLSWAHRDIAIPPRLDAALTGFINGGQAFLNYRWAQFQFLVLLVEQLAARTPTEREQLLTGPWRFRDECRAVLTAMGHNKARAQVHVLQALLFPETFLPIASSQSKRRILTGYGDRLPNPTGDDDRDLLALRTLLQEESDDQVNFFAEPWLGHWRKGASQVGQQGWLVRGSNVAGQNFVPDWLAHGYCSTSFSEMPEIPAGATRPAIQQAVSQAMPDATAQVRGQAAGQLHLFLNQMKPGDVVVTVTPDEVYVGTVEGPALYDPSDGLDRARRRQVKWAPRLLPRALLPEQVQTQLQRPPTVYDISTVAAELAEAAGLTDSVEEELLKVDVTRPIELPPVGDDLAGELLMPVGWLRDTARQLERMRQIILYGPPGTGKTFLARRLAQHVAGPDRTRLVQFHPSYTYEDFFEGFRPVRGDGGTVAFEVVPGPFKLLVDRARQDPANPYVLVIDEINRANLAKVFGELYFLLEYREEPIITQYSPEQEFDLPKNVYIIGTMNTADRSVALVDAAMRRRFAFRRLSPDSPPVAGLLRRWLDRQGLPDRPAALLDALNSRLADPDRAIGPSYLMNRHAADPDGLELIWSTQILPLLEDQLYGTGVDVEEEYGLDALIASLPASPPSSLPAPLPAPFPTPE
ncbi:AAA family ATPase [Streptomyces sp. WI04-05B]|uniref:AAA family ATPase n=1 Tax=Streptomyces TaxID=1883 RepID=UPI0029A4F22E|nr:MULTISPECIES: AAA family ATPase [unclassified Streptomyces]MDX2542818.1 AAA family ATPase [Streptomyces sp. WI04-05B]MDX2588362.1 AAA family ATPase [Streptomyces sp. WI04-05A]